jgi:gluconate 2-dehydrogenase alpha chain
MATRLKDVDAVMVGMGWTGSILARELTKAGLTVVGLERGPDRVPGDDFVLPTIRDELRYGRRSEFIADNSIETVTFRHFPNENALPMRRWGAFSPGEGVGGAGMHWTGHHWRFLPSDFVLKSHTLARYGAGVIPDYMTIEDWGVTYDELEPFFDRFDKLCGTSGKAGNLRGTIVSGGNPFEGVRSSEYPNRATPANCSRRPRMSSAITRSLCRRATPARPTSTPRASRSAPASTAASVRAMAARPTPRRRQTSA